MDQQDGTSRVVDHVSRVEPRIVGTTRPHRGKGGAVKAGLLAAVGDFRFICDADLSMPISELARFLPPVLSKFDVAIGSREGQGARRVGEPAYRHVMGRLFNAMVQLILPGVEDSQCGFKMFTAEAVRAIFPFVTIDGWAFDVEVLAVARAQRLRVVEVPIECISAVSRRFPWFGTASVCCMSWCEFGYARCEAPMPRSRRPRRSGAANQEPRTENQQSRTAELSRPQESSGRLQDELRRDVGAVGHGPGRRLWLRHQRLDAVCPSAGKHVFLRDVAAAQHSRHVLHENARDSIMRPRDV